MNLFMTSMLMLSIMFLFMMHPLSMGSILFLQTIMVSLMSGKIASTFWFSYILFIIMIGGMLVLFMYMTSVASNEKFKTKYVYVPLTLTTCLMIYLFLPTYELTKTKETMKFYDNHYINLTFSKMTNFPVNMMFMMIIIYLLITMIATVKISSFKQGPLRQLN